MRILVITPYFHPVIGGSQNYIVGLFSALRALDPKIQVDVLSYNTENVSPVENIAGLTVYRVPALELLRHQFALPNYWSVWCLMRKLKQQHSYDIVNAHTRFFDTAVWTPFAAKYLGAKSILTDHCAAHPSHPDAIVRATAKLADFLSVKLIFPLYDSVTVVSEATKQFLASLGVNYANVISGGIDPKRFGKRLIVPKSLEFLKKTAKNIRVISFIGRLIPAKGVTHFVDAAQKLVTLNPNVLFVIAGGGELSESLRKVTSPGIKIVGALDESGVTALLAKTDVLVHPSSHHEGLPLMVLEAGAAGCAVVATPSGQVRQLLGKTRGVLCEPSAVSIVKQLLPLIKNRQQTKKLGKNLQAHILANYTWPRSARKFRQLISSLS